MSALKDIMSPKSVAIVGASDDKGRIGGKPLSYMLDQKYSGKIFPVNPKHQTIQGLKSYKSLTEIEDDLDFVLVAVPSIHVTNVLNEAVKKKAKTAVIFSSGFAEMGGIGKKYLDEIGFDLEQNMFWELVEKLDIKYGFLERELEKISELRNVGIKNNQINRINGLISLIRFLLLRKNIVK